MEVNLFNERTSRSIYDAGFTLSCVLLGISAMYGSRAFALGYAVTASFVYLSHHKYSLKTSSPLLAGFALTLAAALTFLYKVDSSAGRRLIYKISYRMWKDHWFYGLGTRGFEKAYNHYQAAYFEDGSYTVRELLLADNTYFAFNDYFQLIIEQGVPGILLVACLFAFVMIVMVALLTGKFENKCWMTFGFSLLLPFLIAACFTHVFERPAFQSMTIAGAFIMLIMCLGTKRRNTGLWILIPLYLAIWGFSARAQLARQNVLHTWQEAKLLAEYGEKKESMALFSELEGKLKNNPAFLVSYADQYLKMHDYGKALRLYLEAQRYQTSNIQLSKIGSCYYQLGRIAEAEAFFRKSVFMVPNRFTTRQQLLIFYVQTGQQGKARLCAADMQKLPVKVPSVKVDKILEDAVRLVKTLPR